MKTYFAPETSFIPPDYDEPERTPCPDSCEGCRFETVTGGCSEGLKEKPDNEQRWANSADALADMLQGKNKTGGL